MRPGHLTAVASVVLAAAAACVSTSATWRGGDASKSAQSQTGMVAAAHPLASAAGAKILAAGGNAVDAAIAASFVISVVRPQSTGVAGGGFLLLHEQRPGKTRAYDFRERAPHRATAALYDQLPAEATLNGAKAVATPGLVPGLAEVHARHGRLPWKTLIEPAIAIARDGFEIYGQLADALKDRKDVLARFPESTAIFFKDGRPFRKGETLIQPELAATLARVARDGADDFIRGETARRMVASMKKHGGLMEAADLLKYKVIERKPLTTNFAGRKVMSMPPPSSGGVAAIEILNILHRDREAIAKSGFASFHHWHMLAEAMRRAFADRANFLGDPDFVQVPLERLTGLEHAAKWRAGIGSTKAGISRDLPLHPGTPKGESGSTTHISVVDGEGNAVATTQTINYSFGSCLVAAGTGVVLNDEMDDFARGGGQPNAYGLIGNAANAIAPGKTPLSSMTPTIVLNAADEVEIVAGSPGGPRIISATLQTLFNRVVFDFSPAESVHAPRIHHQWIPDKLFVELDQAPSTTVKHLKSAGHVVENIKMVGDVQAVFTSRGARNQTHILNGVSDTRSEGEPRGN